MKIELTKDGAIAEGQQTDNSPQELFGKSLTTSLQASFQATRNKQQSLSKVILQDCAFLCISRINKEHWQLLNSFTSGMFIFSVSRRTTEIKLLGYSFASRSNLARHLNDPRQQFNHF